MKSAISWFEIPTTQIDQAKAFCGSVMGRAMRRETMGTSQGEFLHTISHATVWVAR